MTLSQFENELTIHEHTQAGTLDEFHRAYEAEVDDIRSDFGATHPLRIDGDAVETGETFTVTNPGDTDQVLGEFAAGDETHVDEAVAAASDAFDEWKETSWEERVAIFRDAADVIQDRKLEITALMAYENAKHGTRRLRRSTRRSTSSGTTAVNWNGTGIHRRHMSQHLASAASATSSRTASSALWPRSIFRSRSPSE